MAHCPFDFFTDGKKHNICLVGGGGKTTVMYELAAAWAACGRKVLALTSTHILQPADGSFAADAVAVHNLWQQRRYAVIGTPEFATGKLTAPPQDLYEALMLQADVILCEADGSRHQPARCLRSMSLCFCLTVTWYLLLQAWMLWEIRCSRLASVRSWRQSF